MILVEGDAEEILIPTLVKKVLGVSLDELGISLINIRSTGFQNVAVLFHDDRIRKRCSIVTDLDMSIIDTTIIAGDTEDVKNRKKKYLGSQEKGIARKASLEMAFSGNPWISSFFASHTFEVDFVSAGNARKMLGILPDVYKDKATIATAKAELESADVALYGQRALTIANNYGKGWLAILLGKRIDPDVTIPEYILHAIAFAHPTVKKKEVWFNVLDYRLKLLEDDLVTPLEECNEFRKKLTAFRNGEIDFVGVRNEMLSAFPGDRINDVLKVF